MKADEALALALVATAKLNINDDQRALMILDMVKANDVVVISLDDWRAAPLMPMQPVEESFPGRDYFAASALNGMLANGRESHMHRADQHTGLTKEAYLYADAMMKARNGDVV